MTSGELMNGLAGLLGFQVPERAIEGVTSGTRGHRRLQEHARQSLRNLAGEAFEQSRHGFGTFAIASIGHAFAAAQNAIWEPAMRQFRHHYLGFGFGASADSKLPRNRPGFDADGELGAGWINHDEVFVKEFSTVRNSLLSM
jgi:hypothetical protein